MRSNQQKILATTQIFACNRLFALHTFPTIFISHIYILTHKENFSKRNPNSLFLAIHFFHQFFVYSRVRIWRHTQATSSQSSVVKHYQSIESVSQLARYLKNLTNLNFLNFDILSTEFLNLFLLKISIIIIYLMLAQTVL